jgi:hypothetical protein
MKTSILNINSLVNYVKRYEYTNYNIKNVAKKNIYLVLDELVSKKEIILNKKNNQCYIINVGKYYIANPVKNKTGESFYKKLFS